MVELAVNNEKSIIRFVPATLKQLSGRVNKQGQKRVALSVKKVLNTRGSVVKIITKIELYVTKNSGLCR